jgi:hypothetical protein
VSLADRRCLYVTFHSVSAHVEILYETVAVFAWTELNGLAQRYSAVFVRVPPHVISLQLCTRLKLWGYIIQVIHSLFSTSKINYTQNSVLNNIM